MSSEVSGETRALQPTPYHLALDLMLDYVTADTDYKLTPDARRARASMQQFLAAEMPMRFEDAGRMMRSVTARASELRFSLQHLIPEDIYGS